MLPYLGVVLLFVSVMAAALWDRGPTDSAPGKADGSAHPFVHEVKAAAGLESASHVPGTNDAPLLPTGRTDGVRLGSQLGEVLLNPDAVERRRAFLNLLPNLSSADAVAFCQSLVHLRGQGIRRDFEMAAFFRHWGKIDPASALSYLSTQAGTDWTGSAVHGVLYGWGTNSQAQAADWLNANSSFPEFESAFLGYIQGQASRDSAAATQTVLSSVAPTEKLFGSALKAVADSAFERSGYAGVKEWFSALPQDTEPQVRKIAADQAYGLMRQGSLPGTAEWIREQAGSAWRNNAMIGNFAYQYGGSNPSEAMDWVQSLPNDPKIGMLIGVSEVTNQWSRRDPAGLLRWIDANRGTQISNQASYDYALILARTDRASALRLAEGMADATWKAKTLAELSKPRK